MLSFHVIIWLRNLFTLTYFHLETYIVPKFCNAIFNKLVNRLKVVYCEQAASMRYTWFFMQFIEH